MRVQVTCEFIFHPTPRSTHSVFGCEYPQTSCPPSPIVSDISCTYTFVGHRAHIASHISPQPLHVIYRCVLYMAIMRALIIHYNPAGDVCVHARVRLCVRYSRMRSSSCALGRRAAQHSSRGALATGLARCEKVEFNGRRVNGARGNTIYALVRVKRAGNWCSGAGIPAIKTLTSITRLCMCLHIYVHMFIAGGIRRPSPNARRAAQPARP